MKTVYTCHRLLTLVPCLLLICSCTRQNLSREQRAATAQLWQQCAVCHGTAEMQRGPILDGIPQWYLELQLKKFATGIRGQNPKNRGELLMGQAIDKIANDQELERLAAHVAGLPPKKHLRVVKGDVAAGAALYAQRCAACHGDQAEGKPLLRSPPLAILEDWYVADQLRKYASGRRGYHLEDSDGRIMAAAVVGLDQKQIRDLSAWIASLQSK